MKKKSIEAIKWMHGLTLKEATALYNSNSKATNEAILNCYTNNLKKMFYED